VADQFGYQDRVFFQGIGQTGGVFRVTVLDE
jgi:hypothetical protein